MNDRTAAQRPAGTGTHPGARGGVPAARPAPEAPIPPTSEGEKKAHVRPGDRIFSGLATGSGVLVVVLIAAIGVFLLMQAVPSLALNNANFLTSREWSTGDVSDMRFGILDLLLVTVVASLVALAIAMPIALGIALFLTQYAPRKLSRTFAYVIDLLAAVPSIIFGLWGLFILGPVLTPVGEFLTDKLGWIFLFSQGNVSIELGGTIFTAGIVLAVMILPIITAVSREVFDRTPPAHVEGAIALGATKWEVVKTTVLPFGKAGYVSASMLGLGRALGETIALTIILSSTAQAFGWSLFDGGATFASKIALAAPEFNDPKSAGAYVAAGLVLFVLTFVVNAIARSIVAGHKEYE
ncbi:phosphate ABC transporter permease subunit PstC [Actinosynnema pretiosum]|uniref:Phosphate transport system permease protein n=1 Tax=Actinosynnema pretiosum TaxID=42197 RepID=A0A290ZFA7_9PSEU|nr:phosphate ABC transporter permease subunit PstC [Actinosynnema pretiosum]ATE57659.1 phosphate ABC transporter permease subunit PstC [Actinosynnema pretiosum]